MWLYRWFLRLSPEALRREDAVAMEEMFARRLTEARRAGIWRRACLWWRELTGLLVLAVSERCGPAARMRRRQQRMLSGPKAGVMDTTVQEIRQAARRLVRTPVFTLTAALTLALAIGGKRVHLHRGAPGGDESAAVPGVRPADCARLRRSSSQHLLWS